MRLIEQVKVNKVKRGVRRQFNKAIPPVFEKETDLFTEFVLLPTYTMVGEIKNGKVDVLVPDDLAEEIGNSGKFRIADKEQFKKKYRGQKKWDNDDPLDI